MITILHGDHQVESRNRLFDLKKRAQESKKEVVALNGSSLELTDLVQALESQSLFNESRLVIIENLLSNLRPGKRKDEIVSYLVTSSKDSDLILWENKSAGRHIIKLKKQKHVTVEEFKVPVVIFNFVDNITPDNYRESLVSFHKTLENSVVPEVVLAMIVRQFRIMLALTLQSAISETQRLAPWQKGKLEKQAQQFSSERLKKLYKELLIIDYQTKTGASPFDLTKRIEQFIIGL